VEKISPLAGQLFILLMVISLTKHFSSIDRDTSLYKVHYRKLVYTLFFMSYIF